MANAKPKRKRGPDKLTARQDEVKKLLDNGQTVEEIAELMETTPGAIKAQISRIGKLGVEVAVARSARVTSTPRPVETRSVETHISDELRAVGMRLEEVTAALAELAEERTELDHRKGRLEAAAAELTPAPGRLAAVA